MAVCRTRMRVTMPRMRMRTSARVSPTINRRTTMGTSPQCGAEGGKPQQTYNE
nr:MAG TPA: hypothetical protein [Caudoviricetes sp.]DAT21344.1 MAG TPA: hypothetical protein [Caudoviricetes sp.]